MKLARMDAGLSKSELARRAGVARDTITNAEEDVHLPNAATLYKIARVLGKQPSELLAEEERLNPKAPRSSPYEPSLLNGLEEERRARLNEWLKEHGARRAIMSDEQILENFERMASASDRQDIPGRFEQAALEAIEEEKQVLNELAREWTRGGDLIPKDGDSPAGRMRERSRLGQEIRFLYRRYLTSLDRFGEALFLEGRADDFVMVVRGPQIVAARRAALEQLREQAFRNQQSA